MSATLPIGKGLGLPPSRAGAGSSAAHGEMLLGLAMAGLLSVVLALSAGGVGSVARALFMASALALGVLTKRRSPWLFLSATLWIWLTTALARRLVEWHGGFIPTDPILVTPNAMALLIVPDFLGCRGFFARRGVGYALLLAACVAYGLCVSLVEGDLLGGAIAAADWLVPLLYLFLFLCNAARIDEAEAHVSAFLTFSVPFVVAYTLWQYFWMPDWDTRWMTDAGFGSVGKPLALGSRVFGPLNNPGFLAIWAGTCVVLLTHFRGLAQLMLAPFLLLVVAITQVRSVYGSMTLALVAGALTGRGGFARLLSIMLLAGTAVYLGATVLNPLMIEQIGQRLRSLHSLSSDGSAEARRNLYAEIPGLIENNPFGTGIAAQGRGVAATDGAATNIDSGPLSVLLALGWVAGPLYILVMLTLLVHALAIGPRQRSPVAAAMAAAAICPLATFPFVNVIEFQGAVLWICLGYPLAVHARAASRPP